MNEQAQQLLVGLIQKASDGIDSAVAFSQAQIPDVVQQLLVWKFSVSVITGMVCLIIFLIFQNISYKTFKYLRKAWDGDDWQEHPEVMLFILLYVITYLPLLFIDLDWLKIWLAPKLYLIEYAASLVK